MKLENLAFPLQHSDSKKGFTPKELGIPLKEIKRIHIGYCIGEEQGKGKHAVQKGSFHLQFKHFHGAHTHFCKKDSHFKEMCFTKDLLKNSDGTISDILWHEYGHILTAGNMPCMHDDDDEIQTLAHGIEFVKKMTELGKVHCAGRFVTEPY